MYHRRSLSSNPPIIDGKHNMTSLELCKGDDLATMMTVDTVLGFTTHKMDKNYNPNLIDNKLRAQWKEIMENFMINHDYKTTYSRLISSDKIKARLKRDARFERHIFRFLFLFDKRSGIKVGPCYRYENEGHKGAAIFATKEWPKGSQISTLFGCIAEMSAEEEDIFHESMNEFSVMYSTRKNCSQLWLGPAAYVNHDCKPNCRFTEGNDDSKMTLETLRNIHPGDELLIYYGDNFFGTDNAECECFTCELRDQGLFSRNFQSNISRLSFAGPNDADSPLHTSDTPGAVKRITTRSTKSLVTSNDNRSQSFHGALNRLPLCDDTHSLRVTYSRIDRVKERLLTCKNSQKSKHDATLPPKLKRQKPSKFKTLISKPVLESSLIRRRSQRQIDSKLASQHPSPHGTMSNRTKPLLLSIAPGPDTAPPLLSPWFSTRTRHQVTLALNHRQSSLLSKPPNIISLKVATFRHASDTTDSDRPSCSASSPTIPVLEIESETDISLPITNSLNTALPRLRSQHGRLGGTAL